MTSQTKYQVRFDWGRAAAAAVSDGADVIVWIDQLPTTPQAVADYPTVIGGTIQNSAAVASWVIERQAEAGDRFTVAVIAADEPRQGGELRFAVEDLLAAGAVIDALAAVGINYCSPEAAAACAAQTGLRRGVGHLVSASETAAGLGPPLPDLGPPLPDLGPPLPDLGPVDEVPVLR